MEIYHQKSGIFALGNGLMWPSFMSILSIRAGSKLQGAVQGFGSFGALASIFGLIFGGFLHNSIGGASSAGVIFAVLVMSFGLLKMK